MRDGETGAPLQWEFIQELATKTLPGIHSCLYFFNKYQGVYSVPGAREAVIF